MEKRTRRLGHKKSRNGCQRCKARRVKVRRPHDPRHDAVLPKLTSLDHPQCDEGRPCQKCVAHGAHCSLLDHPAPPLTVPAAPPAPSKPPEPAPVRPATSSPYLPESAPDPPSPLAVADPWDLSDHWMMSLRLMHHYSTNTRHILPQDAGTEELWKTTVPEMACSHKFLMHGLLALAALHYAHDHSEERKKWDIISVYHQNMALRFFALRLTDINKDNCEAYFLLATLIFIVSICSVAHSDSLGRTASLDDIAQSFMLLHGVKGILNFQPIEAWQERGGPLALLLRPPVLPPGRSWSSSPFQRRLDAVTALAREVPASFEAVINPQSVCVLALESLRRTHLICKSELGRSNSTWKWSSALPALFVEMISNRHPTALVILAHFAALAWPREKADWTSDGWCAAVVRLVDGALDDSWRSWIEWPKRSVTERIEVDDMDV
ncbi:fungal Zn binuclear cluster domain-containing protein [Colletotrichum graminicola M1.001]|uniref:Fungal Zn binuclear cluster domain-containing protein n=1 Tax=Colletotrichum graminicola (strain M1.001 / M2 / FGSC 10212) TaxID=645133 RepID=E3QH58_COLGM|nr:fungal Zn binuclear cluster domain-containing protein [Colletotrichum graminicola M1.001]EFQ30220.1 fungal Zn binuclear cluster domain-containing protein [Colletotrichum graminicola M1.001]